MACRVDGVSGELPCKDSWRGGLYAPHIASLALALAARSYCWGAAWANPGAALRCAGAQVRASLGLSQFWLGFRPRRVQGVPSPGLTSVLIDILGKKERSPLSQIVVLNLGWDRMEPAFTHGSMLS